ncbi:MAG: hypothetical protein WB763_15350 [Terriglobia bacterium]
MENRSNDRDVKVRSQPIRLPVLLVLVRSRELAVCPRSFIRRLDEVTLQDGGA